MIEPGEQEHEQRLVQRLRDGDRAAMHELIVRYRQPLTRLVARLTGWSADTEDLVQDAFAAALEGAGRFRGDSRLATWLTRIAINICRGYQRRKRLWGVFKRNAAKQGEFDSVDASQRSIQDDRAVRVRQIVQQMRSRYREVVVLHYLQEISLDEVAKILRISQNAVEVRLHRARKKLAETLGSLIEQENG
jgi:RNA polymerase sigma-70 factor (ECF subfamily)